MEVKEFVKSILKDITEAVDESDKKDETNKYHFYLPHDSITDGIDFDLAVLSKKEGKGKIGAEVLGIGGKTEGSISNEIVNRIKFRVVAYKRS